MRIRRILVIIVLAFGVIPAISPFIICGIGLLFGYDPGYNSTFGLKDYHLWWAYLLFFYSLFIAVFVFGIYNLIIIYKIKISKQALPIELKALIFFSLFTTLAFVYDSDFYSVGGVRGNFIFQKIIYYLIISVLMVSGQYFLIDEEYEERTGLSNKSL